MTALWFKQHCRNPNFWQSIIIGDEAGFAINGEVNSQNVREYASKGHPPAFNFERMNPLEKLTIWAALCSNGVILGPYFFDQNVNCLAYLRMLNECFSATCDSFQQPVLGWIVSRPLVGTGWRSSTSPRCSQRSP